MNELLNFPEDSAGSIMTTEFIEFKEGITIQEGFDIIRKTGLKKETVYWCYVVDKSRKLIGSVDIKEMLTESSSREEFMFKLSKLIMQTYL